MQRHGEHAPTQNIFEGCECQHQIYIIKLQYIRKNVAPNPNGSWKSLFSRSFHQVPDLRSWWTCDNLCLFFHCWETFPLLPVVSYPICDMHWFQVESFQGELRAFANLPGDDCTNPNYPHHVWWFIVWPKKIRPATITKTFHPFTKIIKRPSHFAHLIAGSVCPAEAAMTIFPALLKDQGGAKVEGVQNMMITSPHHIESSDNNLLFKPIILKICRIGYNPQTDQVIDQEELDQHCS